ncbi:hypothetical protein JQV19_19360 [Sulfitobacter mediterraneus]|uniref:hypothetical protein n=1 Tax=Sulfitobacter mediterraneus TaxID=83219 RepID=UPI001939AC69|nr:hypothetical protein [Sulfitobacter mediterraneus]MBM1577969.1 hypothetical protein [Sulfitobacter mediterraneus]MBM1593181.1 hypothetical protein [Sulfitobacter mediterraneus]MBM1596987.1 hypothetical protein [Sulfitobacter mediterraneus]MBM1604593.1 hypothetical protein [Sulfitobacter mediterraneus]MBM1608395.1 hypothetical protein [Sulfitobacter mediterraneus]
MNKKNELNELDDWIANHCKEFANVPVPTRGAAYLYMVLWSIFDGRYLEHSGSRESLMLYAETLPDQIEITPFEPYLDYFRKRLESGHHLRDLAGDDYQTKDYLRSTSFNASADHREQLIGLVLISYRLRCNLVHGDKYRVGLRDQYDNLVRGCQLTKLFLEEAWRPKNTNESGLTWD